jgi:hypothetical protein
VPRNERLPIMGGHRYNRLDARDLAQHGEESSPIRPLRGENLPPLFRDAVIATTALTRLLHPPTLDPAPLFHAIQRRVKGSQRESQIAAGTALNQLRDFA